MSYFDVGNRRKNVIVIGELPNYAGKQVSWDSKFNFGEADALVLAPGGGLALFNNAILGNRTLDHFKKTYEPVFTTILEGVKRGQILIYFLEGGYGWPDNVRKYSWSPFHLEPLNAVTSFLKVSGSEGMLLNPNDYLDKNDFGRSKLPYSMCIENSSAVPLFTAKAAHADNDYVVGAYIKHGEGLIVLAPMNGPIAPAYINSYIYSLLQISHKILEKKSALSAPDWLEKFCLKDEVSLRDKIDEFESEISVIKGNIAAVEIELDKFNSIKRLLWTTGDDFEDVVIEALLGLGFNAIKGVNSHTDILAFDGSKLWAIEAKGLEGGVKDKNTSQLGKWKSEVETALLSGEADRKADAITLKYYECLKSLAVPMSEEELLVECSSLFVVNPYYNLPLSMRGENYLTNVNSNLARRDYYSLTGIQLLGLYNAVREGLVSKDDAREMIGKKPGVMCGYETLQNTLIERI